MDRCGNTPFSSLAEHGIAGIAAGSQYHVGRKAFYQRVGLSERPSKGPDSVKIVGKRFGRRLSLKI